MVERPAHNGKAASSNLAKPSKIWTLARMVELVDTLGLGSSFLKIMGSSPFSGNITE